MLEVGVAHLALHVKMQQVIIAPVNANIVSSINSDLTRDIKAGTRKIWGQANNNIKNNIDLVYNMHSYHQMVLSHTRLPCKLRPLPGETLLHSCFSMSHWIYWKDADSLQHIWQGIQQLLRTVRVHVISAGAEGTGTNDCAALDSVVK